MDLGVPSEPIRRLRFPDEINRESFEAFASKSQPVIIEGLVADWPAFSDEHRGWASGRLDVMGEEMLDVGFDPLDSRMMHFGDQGEEDVLINPGRLRMPAWAFFEVARLRQIILRLRAQGADLKKDTDLQRRLSSGRLRAFS